MMERIFDTAMVIIIIFAIIVIPLAFYDACEMDKTGQGFDSINQHNKRIQRSNGVFREDLQNSESLYDSLYSIDPNINF